MKDSTVTARILVFQKTGEKRTELEHEIALLAYRYVHGNKSLTEDEAGDFFCEYYPKIISLIDSFSYQGRPFEAYLYVSLRWHILHFKKKTISKRLSNTFFSMNSIWEVDQNPPDYYGQFERLAGECPAYEKVNKTEKKRLIYLALRESEYLSHALVEEIVSAAGVDRRWFLNCVMALKGKLDRRRERLENARRYHNRCFYQYHILQLRLQQCPDRDTRGNIEDELLKTRERLRRSAEKVKQLHIHPTNREISEVLNIPKGTIDSGIYYLKNRYRASRKDEAA